MAKKQAPQTFEKRARERDKQAKRIAKQAERTAKSAARKQLRHEELVASYGQKPVSRPAMLVSPTVSPSVSPSVAPAAVPPMKTSLLAPVAAAPTPPSASDPIVGRL